MDLAVIHRIHDPAAWSRALESDHSFPPEFQLHSFVEADRGDLALCVWEATDEPTLQSAVDAVFGHAAVNEVIPVQLRHMGGYGVEDYVPAWRSVTPGDVPA